MTVIVRHWRGAIGHPNRRAADPQRAKSKVSNRHSPRLLRAVLREVEIESAAVLSVDRGCVRAVAKDGNVRRC